jgi:tetratricopeptide (TPR) repeat protein
LQNKTDIGEANVFSWEYPLPDNEFWNTLDFVVGRNFLQCFSEDEIKQMHFDDTLSKRGKLELLLNLLREKLSSQDAAAAPQTLYCVNYAAWDKLLLGISTM